MAEGSDDGSRPPDDRAVWEDLSDRASDQLLTLQRARERRLVAAVAVLACGILLATLPLGSALVIPATVLFVGGLFAAPITGFLLVSARLEIARRDPRPPAGGR